MHGRPFFAVILIGAIAVPLVSSHAAGERQSRVKDWSEPDVSMKLENRGKESPTGRILREHETLANSLFSQKNYEEAAREYQKCVDLDPRDFRAHLFLGISFYDLHRYDDAIDALKKADELWPGNFDANLWLGISRARIGQFKDAVPNLEKAREARKEDKFARRELALCYFITGQPEQAFQLYPRVIGIIGGVLLLIYFAWFAAMLPFSLPIRNTPFPGLRFSFAWLALFIEGQIAFLFLLPSLRWLKLPESVFTGSALAGLPIVTIAAARFARQPWGVPFRWPLRFGTPKTLLISLGLLFLNVLVGAGFSKLYVELVHKPVPLQPIIPFIKNALQANAVIAWLLVALAIPLIEEVLFRGLLFGAFEKRWGVKGAILGSSFLFVCVHLQLVGFLYPFCFGLILGWARWQSRSLGLPILIHSLNNAMALLALTFSIKSGST
jgi:membrane protease YdiL (CAAX protease family)